jgi:hypothetical protein
MSSWEKRYTEHELWTKVKLLQDQLAEMDAPEAPDARDSLEYLVAVTELAAARRTGTPALQVTETMLVDLAQKAQSVIDQLASWREEAITDSQMDTATQSIVQALAGWPPLSSQQNLEADTAAVTKICEAADRAIDSVTQQRDELAEKLSELESKRAALETKIEEQTQVVTDAVSTFQQDSSTRLEECSEAWKQEREKQKSSAEQKLETLAELEKQARGLVHATTATVVATDYGKYARNKTIAAWICDVAAALIGGVGVGAIIWHLYSAEAGADGDVGLSLTRLAASLGTLGVAALVAHRGHDHHNEARAAKRTDLATRRVGPFTANLPPDVRERITLEVTERIFIRGELDEPAASNGSGPSLVDRIVQLRGQNTEPPAGSGAP